MAVASLLTLKPEQRAYEPRGSASEVLYCKDRIVVACGPAGTGKSRAILEKIHILCCHFQRLRVLVVRKTRESLTEAALYTYEEEVLANDDWGSFIKKGATRKFRSSYTYPNGSMIKVIGLDDNTADKVMSTQWDIIFIQEGIEVDEETTEKLEMRLRSSGEFQDGRFRQLIIDTNPGAPTHWILKWVQQGRAKMVLCRKEDNPVYYNRDGTRTALGQEYYGAMEKKKGHLLDRYYYGKWVQPEGARWSILDERVHGFNFREKFPQGIPEGWPITLGVDYGIRAPFAGLWMTTDYDGDVWMFREVYEPNLTAVPQARKLIEATGLNERIAVVRVDPAMRQKPQRHEQSQPDDKSPLHHYQTILSEDPRFGPIEMGYSEGYSRMHGEQLLDTLFEYDNGFPNLHIETERCANTWAEFTGAVYPKDGRKECMDSENCPDHGITATIYGLYGNVQRPQRAIPPPTVEQARIARLEEIRKLDEQDFIRRTQSGRRSRGAGIQL